MHSFIYRTASFCAAFAYCIAVLAHAHAAPNALSASEGDLKGLQITKPIYAWKTEHEKDPKEGTFNHCLVKNMYDNGTVLMLAENHSGVQRVALHFPQDKMDVGQHFDLTIQVDKRDLFPVEAIAVSEQILTIGIPEALPDQMRKGQAMYLRGPNDEVIYTLDGMDGAVTALRDCVMTQKNPEMKKVRDDTQVADKPNEETKVAETAPVEKKPAAQIDPQPIKPPEKVIEKKIEIAEAKTVEKPVAPVAEKTAKKEVSAKPDPRVAEAKPPTPKAEAPKTAPKIAQKPAKVPLLPAPLQAIVSPAGLMPQTLLNAKPSATDYLWQQDGLFVSIKEHNGLSAAQFEKTTLHYLSLLKKRCTGTFIAESAPPMKNKTGSMSWQIAETACSSKTGQDTIAAALFSHDGSQLRVYLIEGPADRGADSIKARDRLLPYALRSN